MAINRAQIRKQLVPGLNAVFGLEYKEFPEEWKEYLSISKESNRAYVEDVLMTGFGGASVKAEGAGVAYDSASESYTSRYIFETVALAFALTEEAMEDNLYGDLGSKMSKALARSMQYTKNVKCANIINNGYDTAYAGGDGKPLFSASHPTKSGTGSNLLSTPADLSETSLEDVLILIGQATDDRGIPMALKVKKLHIPIQSQFIARRLLGGDERPGTADRDINAVRQMGILSANGVAMSHYFTDPDQWFLSTDCADGLKYIERSAIKTGMEGDFESGNLRYKSRERYVAGWSDWRGAFGTPGA